MRLAHSAVARQRLAVWSPSAAPFLTPLKHAINALATVLVAPIALTCSAEQALSAGSTGLFRFWGQFIAFLPGTPGVFIRRAFYRWTLERCAETVTIGFGTLFSRRNVVLEDGVFIGSYALIGSARIGRNALIGSRASLLSGGSQHTLLECGEWSATEESQLRQIVIGSNTWIGEGAILMADVGDCCMVATGAVVSASVPDGVMVGGNPARFVRRIRGVEERAN